MGTYFTPEENIEDVSADNLEGNEEETPEDEEQLGSDASSKTENVERIEWNEGWAEWVALPRGLCVQMFFNTGLIS